MGPAAHSVITQICQFADATASTDTRISVGWEAPHLAEVIRQRISCALGIENARLLSRAADRRRRPQIARWAGEADARGDSVWDEETVLESLPAPSVVRRPRVPPTNGTLRAANVLERHGSTANTQPPPRDPVRPVSSVPTAQTSPRRNHPAPAVPQLLNPIQQSVIMDLSEPIGDGRGGSRGVHIYDMPQPQAINVAQLAESEDEDEAAVGQALAESLSSGPSAQPASSAAVAALTQRTPSSSADVCPVCQDSMSEVNTYVMPCGHEFCADCLLSWLTQNHTCPTCRRPIEADYDAAPVLVAGTFDYSSASDFPVRSWPVMLQARQMQTPAARRQLQLTTDRPGSVLRAYFLGLTGELVEWLRSQPAHLSDRLYDPLVNAAIDSDHYMLERYAFSQILAPHWQDWTANYRAALTLPPNHANTLDDFDHPLDHSRFTRLTLDQALQTQRLDTGSFAPSISRRLIASSRVLSMRVARQVRHWQALPRSICGLEFLDTLDTWSALTVPLIHEALCRLDVPLPAHPNESAPAAVGVSAGGRRRPVRLIMTWGGMLISRAWSELIARLSLPIRTWEALVVLAMDSIRSAPDSWDAHTSVSPRPSNLVAVAHYLSTAMRDDGFLGLHHQRALLDSSNSASPWRLSRLIHCQVVNYFQPDRRLDGAANASPDADVFQELITIRQDAWTALLSSNAVRAS
jgi:hypothetical protein